MTLIRTDHIPSWICIHRWTTYSAEIRHDFLVNESYLKPWSELLVESWWDILSKSRMPYALLQIATIYLYSPLSKSLVEEDDSILQLTEVIPELT